MAGSSSILRSYLTKQDMEVESRARNITARKRRVMAMRQPGEVPRGCHFPLRQPKAEVRATALSQRQAQVPTKWIEAVEISR